MADLPDRAWPVVLQHFRGADAAADGAADREFHRRYLEARQRAAGTSSTPAAPAAAAAVDLALERLRALCDDDSAQRTLRTSLALFADFRTKQRAAALEKLQQTRAKLPVAAHADGILEALRASQVLVLAGDTGCGKSTQVPQFLLREYGRVACTQPRRLAAVSLARRVSIEGNGEHGVGHQIRFESRAAPSDRIVFMTEGVMLRHIAGGAKGLDDFDVIVLDEVHERHTSTDVLLGTMRGLLARRPALRLVLMSATLNLELFSSFFGGAPVLRVPGRAYPVDVVHVTADADVAVADAADGSGAPSRKMLPSRAHELLGPKLFLKVLQRIDAQFDRRERGDALCFLSGVEEIERLMEPLREYAASSGRWVVLPLHASLPVAEQERVFDLPPSGVRKCILATNVAETSVTIDGVRFVVDSGAVKQSFDPDARMQSPQAHWVSQAFGAARPCRADGTGHCYRPTPTPSTWHWPSSRRPSCCARPSKAWRSSSLDDGGGGGGLRTSFPQPPPAAQVDAALLSLRRLQALDPFERLTPLGAALTELPVDVHCAKMLVLGELLGMGDLMRTLAAALSVPSPLLKLGGHRDGAAPAAATARLSLLSRSATPSRCSTCTMLGWRTAPRAATVAAGAVRMESTRAGSSRCVA